MFGLVQRILIALLILASASPMGQAAAQSHSQDCSAYDAWIWAQAVYDQDPDTYSGLDPDGNGIACEQLSVGGFSPTIWASEIPSNVTPATVVRVSDGDTIRVRLADGSEVTVRLLHMDTPETGGSIGQCGGTESTEYLSWILSYASGGTVYLESDSTERDRYDRRLAYVWFSVDGDPNPYMANYSMILAGWAESETYKPDVKYKAQLDEAEQFSVNHVTGVRLQCGKFGRPANDAGPSDEQIKQAWNNQPNQGQLPAFPGSAPVVEQPPAQSSVNQAVVAPAANENCDSSYPDVCIPPYSQVGDLDCGDVSYRRFRVVPPDPHGFDGDFDGVGCEGG